MHTFSEYKYMSRQVDECIDSLTQGKDLEAILQNFFEAGVPEDYLDLIYSYMMGDFIPVGDGISIKNFLYGGCAIQQQSGVPATVYLVEKASQIHSFRNPEVMIEEKTPEDGLCMFLTFVNDALLSKLNCSPNISLVDNTPVDTIENFGRYFTEVCALTMAWGNKYNLTKELVLENYPMVSESRLEYLLTKMPR